MIPYKNVNVNIFLRKNDPVPAENSLPAEGLCCCFCYICFQRENSPTEMTLPMIAHEKCKVNSAYRSLTKYYAGWESEICKLSFSVIPSPWGEGAPKGRMRGPQYNFLEDCRQIRRVPSSVTAYAVPASPQGEALVNDHFLYHLYILSPLAGVQG